jgi:hypothetical protein
VKLTSHDVGRHLNRVISKENIGAQELLQQYLKRLYDAHFSSCEMNVQLKGFSLWNKGGAGLQHRK